MNSQQDLDLLNDYKAQLVDVNIAISKYVQGGGVSRYKLDTGQSTQEVERKLSSLQNERAWLMLQIGVLQDNLSCGGDSTIHVA